MPNPERGILTPRDEEYIKNPETYGQDGSNQRDAQYKARERIKERIGAAINDFELLFKEWSDEKLKEFFDEFEQYSPSDDSDPGIDEQTKYMIAFLFKGFNLLSHDSDEFIPRRTIQQALLFRKVLRQGIKEGKSIEQFGDPPERVLVDSNTRLHELPSEEKIDIDWNDAGKWNRMAQDTVDLIAEKPYLGGEDKFTRDDANSSGIYIDKEKAEKITINEINRKIANKLAQRRERANEPLKRYDNLLY